MSDPFNRVMQFKAHLRLEVLDSERAFLLGEREQYMLTGRSQVLVAGMLDGRRSVQQVIDGLDGQVSAPEVLYALAHLEKKGHLSEAGSELPPQSAALWQALGVTPAEAHSRLVSTPVAVHALEGLEPAPLIEALRGAGLTVQEGASLHVVLVQDYLAPELEAFNRRAMERRESWFLVKPSGAMPWMGPVFRPGEGPCWACLAQRLRWNRPVETFLREHKGPSGSLLPPRAEVPASLQAGMHLAALALARWIASGKQGALGNTLLSLELPRFQLTEHSVVRRPQCPVCGDGELLKKRAEKPVVLESRPRGFTEDNGFRTVTPEQTFARLQHQLSPLTGALCTLAPLESRTHPLRPVFASTFFCPVPTKTPHFTEFHAMSLGKGRTPAQSRASALGEGIERWSSLFQGDEPRFSARLSELGEVAYHPHSLLLFSEDQYRDREAINRRHQHERMGVPMPFDERVEVEWTPVWSLTHERRRYLPTSFCYNRYPAPPNARFSTGDSNGTAAGNCLEEAILQGFLELAERDAVGIWWYNRLRRPGVDLSSFHDPYFQALQENYRSQQWKVWALDLTQDLQIPTFVALGMSSRTGAYCIGFGAHLDARIALQRSLTEFNQIFDPSDKARSPWAEFKMEDPSFLHPDDTVPLRTLADYPQPPQQVDIRDDVRTCVAKAERAGMETLVLDLTRPDVDLHVVKVTVPGLRHFWPRFAPGRLYDVPVKMGWRSSPLTEAQLNPVPILL